MLFEEEQTPGFYAAFERPAHALQPDDRIQKLHARLPGAVVRSTPMAAPARAWDDGEPQEAGLATERMPRNLLVKMAAGAPPSSGVDAAFETRTATAAGHVNDGDAARSAAPGRRRTDSGPAEAG